MTSDPRGAIVVRGGRDLTGARRDVHIVDGVIAHHHVDPPRQVLDAAGCIVAPGLIDLQVSGAAGVDLTAAPGRLWEVAAALPRFGVTSFCPTIVTAPREVVAHALAVLAAGVPGGVRGARPIGLHLEGPMIAHARVGAHDATHVVAPSSAAVDGWSRSTGVAMVTLAPELAGATAVIAELVARGVVVSAGHTDATAQDLAAAVRAGLRGVTHLFNAMAPMHHREPGLVGAVLAGAPVTASLIADGVHLDPDVVRVAWRALGPERRILVSDAVAALGAPPGRYRLAGREVVFDGRSVRTTSGELAGAAVGLDACVRNVVQMTGCTPADAVDAATVTPARLIGRPDLGSLRPGAAGDVVVLDGDLRVVATIVAGVVVFGGADG